MNVRASEGRKRPKLDMRKVVKKESCRSHSIFGLLLLATVTAAWQPLDARAEDLQCVKPGNREIVGRISDLGAAILVNLNFSDPASWNAALQIGDDLAQAYRGLLRETAEFPQFDFCRQLFGRRMVLHDVNHYIVATKYLDLHGWKHIRKRKIVKSLVLALHHLPGGIDHYGEAARDRRIEFLPFVYWAHDKGYLPLKSVLFYVDRIWLLNTGNRFYDRGIHSCRNRRLKGMTVHEIAGQTVKVPDVLCGGQTARAAERE